MMVYVDLSRGWIEPVIIVEDDSNKIRIRPKIYTYPAILGSDQFVEILKKDKDDDNFYDFYKDFTLKLAKHLEEFDINKPLENY